MGLNARIRFPISWQLVRRSESICVAPWRGASGAEELPNSKIARLKFSQIEIDELGKPRLDLSFFFGKFKNPKIEMIFSLGPTARTVWMVGRKKNKLPINSDSFNSWSTTRLSRDFLDDKNFYRKLKRIVACAISVFLGALTDGFMRLCKNKSTINYFRKNPHIKWFSLE